jgi:heptosyltransferase-3
MLACSASFIVFTYPLFAVLAAAVMLTTYLIVQFAGAADVLLTTPLIRSLKRAFPDAAIDLYLARVITMPAPPTSAETVALACRLWRRYDLAEIRRRR